MIKEIISRIKQGYRTIKYPFSNIKLSDRYLGYPKTNFSSLGESEVKDIINICPTDAISVIDEPQIDLGSCIFCGRCYKKYPSAINFTQDYRMGFKDRDDLIVKDGKQKVVLKHDIKTKKIFLKSLKLRQVSAGGCNACEADLNVLSTPAFDIGRFSIEFVASPRHADGIVITGPVTKNMELALRKTYNAIPSPKIVIAVGACSISGGLFKNHSEVKGIPKDIKVDLYIPGCPPNPMTILDSFLKFLGK